MTSGRRDRSLYDLTERDDDLGSGAWDAQTGGDFSVNYRCAGILEKSRTLISTRAKLRAAMLDALHAHGIEIVSPTFMNQRPLKDDQVFIPEADAPGDDAVFQDDAPDKPEAQSAPEQ